MVHDTLKTRQIEYLELVKKKKERTHTSQEWDTYIQNHKEFWGSPWDTFKNFEKKINRRRKDFEKVHCRVVESKGLESRDRGVVSTTQERL